MSWSELERLVSEAEEPPSPAALAQGLPLGPRTDPGGTEPCDRIISNDLLDFLAKACRPYWEYGI